MAIGKYFCVYAIVCLTVVSTFSISYNPQSRGRKLFGGYRIVPKVCRATNPSRIKSNEPAICMFNYECSRRNGEVVGACMDGFLFGACCQLPPKNSQSVASFQANSSPSTENLLNLHEIDHVPEIPILLNPDGTPIGIGSSDSLGTTKINFHGTTNNLNNLPGSYTKIPTFSPDRSTQRPFTDSFHHDDVTENAEKQRIPGQVDLSHLETDFPALLGQQEILDDLRLPGLVTHSDSNNDIQDHQETDPINPVTTLLSPDQILQIADPVDQLPALFAQGLGQNNHSGADTVLLNKNGTYLNENNNPDELFKPNTSVVANENKIPIDYGTQTTSSIPGSSKYYDRIAVDQQYENNHKNTGTNSGVKYTNASPGSTESRTPVRTTNFLQSSSQSEKYSNSKTTTPMSSTYNDNDDQDDDLVRVPTITYDIQSGNKKHDELDREEIAINHIISILNATTPSSPTKFTQQMQHGTSSIHTWTNVEEISKPSPSRLPQSRPSTTTENLPYTFYKPGIKPSTYYHYDTASTPGSAASSSYSTSNFYTSRTPTATKGSYGSSNGYDYSTRPSTNPPAPTVIVLGPYGTEYTTITTQKPASRRPTTNSIRPSIVTKQPNIGTTITHNISTVISTSNTATSNNHVFSTSYISVNLKDSSSPKPNDQAIVQGALMSNSEGTKNPVVTKKPSTIWTTLSSWSDKPSFHLKPSKPDFIWPNDKPVHTVVFKESTVSEKPATVASITKIITKNSTTQSSTICDDETPAPDDLINFPPVRNPNLTQQEKPTIVQIFNDTDLSDIEILNENEIPTPSFVEDDVLTDKVDVFVDKIVQSLQNNFQDLKDVVYSKKNVTATSSANNITTKKPPTKKPARPTSVKPSQTTRRPPIKKPVKPSVNIQKPSGDTTVVKPAKPTTLKPRPTSVVSSTTKRPQTVPSKRKPTRKPTTTTTTTTTLIPEAVIEDVYESSDSSIEIQDETSDYRRECGVRPLVKRGRIVGGKGASFAEWPWQVLVREATWLGLFTKNKCGGVLITKNYVITAAHCQPGFLASLVAVFGEFDISGELESKRSVTRNVRRVIVNRGYNPATFENDLALLELEKPIEFDAHIVPICMPDDGADFTGRMATVTGWGRVKYNGGTPSVLQEVQVPIMENAVCQEMFRTAGHSKLILDSFLCAGYASGQKDSCEGDSGGPLTMEGPDGRWILVGTVSHGIKCAAPYLPGVYMRTTFFKPWLHSVTGV